MILAGFAHLRSEIFAQTLSPLITVDYQVLLSRNLQVIVKMISANLSSRPGGTLVPMRVIGKVVCSRSLFLSICSDYADSFYPIIVVGSFYHLP